MISAEAPVLFAKATEIFIHELTQRAWIHTEDNKRRTLQRNDIAMAITKYDQFDFLIDIVPRDDIKPTPTKPESTPSKGIQDELSYYVSLAQQQQQTQNQQQTLNNTTVTTQQQQPQRGQAQLVQTASSGGVQTIATVGSNQQQQVNVAPQIIQLQPQQMVTSQQSASAPPPGGIQIVQQIMTPSGDIQQIPIQLSPQQLQVIRSQMIGGTTQPIVIQTAPIQAINTMSGAPTGNQQQQNQQQQQPQVFLQHEQQ
eukprot:TRINITY_DN17351_c0_g1_i5.p1 TRINITY_DN17351_c0_g1~~TRINITY_DN17351_c0_g1_i5.p1  ORF type:complete len:268 (+),score=76.66 TRINITY_DN17351_c0_g1_i5:40-804(+)